MTHAAPVPRAPQVPFVREFHGDAVSDPFHWMADKDDPRLIAYLQSENAFTEQATAHLDALKQSLFDDIAARTKQTDLSVPIYIKHVDRSQFWYYTRTVEGLDYPIHCRAAAFTRDDMPDVSGSSPDEQILLDVNALAAGHEFFALGWSEVSASGRLLAYSVDVVGEERFDLYVKDLASGELLGEPIKGVGYGGSWVADDWLFYLRVDDAWRPFEVWRHRLGASPDEDELVYREEDERFWLWLDSSRDESHVSIEASSKLTSETLLIPQASPTDAPRPVCPRRQGVEYSVDIAGDRLLILHNAAHPQFELAWAPVDASGSDNWTTILSGRDDRRLISATAYGSTVVVTHRTDGLAGVGLVSLDADARPVDWQEITFADTVCDVDVDHDPNPDADRFRISYESLVTPPTLFERRLGDPELRVLKQTPVLDHPEQGPFASDRYVQERRWAIASDGTRVPITLARRKDTPIDGSAPCVLMAYGAYETSTDPYFSIARLSLLDRGFIYAIAHVRGGGEFGRPWHDSGKLMAKRNTFTDFVACGRQLVADGYTSPERLIAEGGSAGGLLVGAAFNLAPDLFAGVLAMVPFVDVLTTMLDPSLPLTVVERDEWGDPLNDPDAYSYLKGYSPYENVTEGVHPALLVTTSLHDTRVEITEPAKWVAKLRTLSTPDAPSRVLLKTEMAGGHGGASGRYNAWRDRAFELAWMIDVATQRRHMPYSGEPQ